MADRGEGDPGFTLGTSARSMPKVPRIETQGSLVVAGRTCMQYPSWRLWSVLVSVLAIPFIFVGVLYIWATIDESLGSREVSQYIRDHQSIVSQRLKNPKV